MWSRPLQRAAKAGESRPRGNRHVHEITTLWSDADLKCVLLWDGTRYWLQLLRGDHIVSEEIGADDAALIGVSRRWRDIYERDGTVPGGGNA